MTDKQAAAGETNQLVITRTFNAPRELVFRTWTEEQHLKRWWGPAGCQIEIAQFDLRPGGIMHYSMSIPGGFVMWGKFIFHEIQAPEKLVFSNCFADEEGNTIRAPFAAAFPLEIMNELTFTEEDGKTILTMRGGPVNATEEEMQFFGAMHDSMQQGFGGTFAQLDEYLAQL